MNRRTFITMTSASAGGFLSSCTHSGLWQKRHVTYPYRRFEMWRRNLTHLTDFLGFDTEIERPLRHIIDDYAKWELLTQAGSAVAARERSAPPTGVEMAPGTRTSNRWRVAESLLKLRQQVNALAPHRSKRDDGFVGDASHQSRASDHNPWVRDNGIGVVTAFDITNDPAHGCRCQAIVDSLVASRDARIKYIIWNRRIINRDRIGSTPAWTWRRYGGSNPHNMHLHLSVLPTKRLYDDRKAWAVRVA